jgi:hypothetical protein
MRKIILGLMGAAAMAGASAASAQITTCTTTANTICTLDQGMGGTTTAGFSASNLGNPFFETLSFNTAVLGNLQVGVSTTATGTANDTDFSSILLFGPGLAAGGVLVPNVSGDPVPGTELNSRFFENLAAGSYRLEIRGTPGTNQTGSFGGSLAFSAANAVPEPGTWAMMLLGFGAMGVSMRPRRKPNQIMQIA